MSVVWFKERAVKDAEMQLGSGGQMGRYRRQFLAKVSDKTDGPEVFTGVAGLPQFGNIVLLPTGPVLMLRMRPSHHPQGDPRFWVLDYEYESVNTDPNNPRNMSLHPLSRPPDVSYGHAYKMRVMYEDADGQPIVTSSREQFEPLYEEERYFQVLVVTRNQAQFDTQQSREYINKTNEDDYLGGAPGTVLCKDYSATSVYDTWEGANLAYWKVRYEFHYDEDGWDFEPYDRGFYELVDVGMVGNKEQKHMVDAYGSFIAVPKYLDGHGAHLGESPDMVPVKLKFKVKKRKPFNVLPAL